MNVDDPNVYCSRNRHNKWMSTSTIHVYCWTDTTNECLFSVPNLLSPQLKHLTSTNECRRSAVNMFTRHSYVVTAQQKQHRWMLCRSAFQMFTCWTDDNKWMSSLPNVYCWVVTTVNMNVDVPNVYCWTDTTNECRRSKCLLLSKHLSRHSFVVSTAVNMNVDLPNVCLLSKHLNVDIHLLCLLQQ